MKYLPVVGPVTQFQPLDQHCTISKHIGDVLITNKFLREISVKTGQF